MGGGPLMRTQSISVTSQSNQNALEKSRLPSTGVYVTTTDAHTLTDGPTIFLTEDVEKIGRFLQITVKYTRTGIC